MKSGVGRVFQHEGQTCVEPRKGRKWLEPSAMVGVGRGAAVRQNAETHCFSIPLFGLGPFFYHPTHLPHINERVLHGSLEHRLWRLISYIQTLTL